MRQPSQPQQPQQGGTMRDVKATIQGGTKRDTQPQPQPDAPEVRVLKRDEGSSSAFTEITLDGVKYRVESTISASTGEAVVYKLSNGGRFFALKLYYAGFEPDAKVMDALAKCAGTGFLVDILGHGTWTSPQGEVRYYELQPFYDGGSLQPGSIANKPDDLKAAAAAMMMALRTAHDHNILHKDIKPENFFYADAQRSRLVLADFGIASTFQRDAKGNMLPLKSRVQWRTKVYAAPEIYTSIDGEIQYDDLKSDYYSLGISLLTLWSGSSQLESIDERSLLRMKKRGQGEQGALPIPQDMPEQIRHLVMGLTVANPENRWGFDEFERWLAGEDVPIAGAPVQDTSAINILWSGSKGQRARSLQELAALIATDRALAQSYLFQGKISQWLLEAGFPELQVKVDEIYRRTYARNQNAAVMATAYLIDPDLPYFSPTDRQLNTQEQIAADMIANDAAYLHEISNADSTLYIWFAAAGLNIASRFVQLSQANQLNALWELIFTLNPSAPFPLPKDPAQKSSPANRVLVNTVDELLDHMSAIDTATPTGYLKLITEPAFSHWLSHRDASLAGKLQSRLSEERPANLGYALYLLDPARNYFFKRDQSTAFSIEQIAEMLNADMMKYYAEGRVKGTQAQHLDSLERVKMLYELGGSRLYYYLKSKDMYKDKFDYLAYCFDFNSADNRRKPCGYTRHTAEFKAIKALTGGTLFYTFPRSGKTIGSIDELSSVPSKEVAEELRDGLLSDWLAAQLHEDPYADLSERYAYERLLAQYTELVAKYNPDQPEVKRYEQAQAAVKRGAARCRRMAYSIMAIRGVWALLVALPLLGLAALAVLKGTSPIFASWGWLSWIAQAVVFTLIVRGVELLLPKGHEWLLEPFGEKLVDNVDLLESRWIVAGIYGVGYTALIVMLSSYGASWGCYAFAAVCLAALAWRAYRCIIELPMYMRPYHYAMHPDDEALYLEPLHYAYKDKGSRPFDSETIDGQKTYIEGESDLRMGLIKRTLWSLIPVALLAYAYISHSPMAAEYIRVHDPDRYAKLVSNGQYQANLDSYRKYVVTAKSSLALREGPSKSSKKVFDLKPGTELRVLGIEDGWAKVLYGRSEYYVSADYIKPAEGVTPFGADEETPAQASPAPSAKAKDKTKSNSNSSSNSTTTTQSQPKADEQPQAQAAPAAEAATETFKVRTEYKGSAIEHVDVFRGESDILDNIVGQLAPGAQVQVIERLPSGYAKIKYNGGTAYVKSQYIEK